MDDPSQGLSGGPWPRGHSGDPWRINKFGVRDWLTLGSCNIKIDHQKLTGDKNQQRQPKQNAYTGYKKVAFQYDM